MADITFIILTKNEEKNIEACIKSIGCLSNRIYVVDSGSNDNTVELAKMHGAEVVYHEWCGHAAQFNWALDNLRINSKWVFRLDADERISDDLRKEIEQKLASEQLNGVNGYEMRWRVYFMNKWIRHGGTHKPYFLRLFRYGYGRVEDKIMDEHIIVKGSVEKLSGDLIHYDYKGLDAWLSKHIWYSQLELSMYQTQLNQSENKRQQQKRNVYYSLPLFFRARLYYIYRYYFQLGFLDGKEGRIFIYLQSYWYRFIIDSKIYEIEFGQTQK